MSIKDTYHTIAAPSTEILYKDRNSKFYGYVYPVQDETMIKTHLDALKKQHHQAGHFCYAWQLGVAYERYRYNDDGEPSNSAGAPIYGQLQSYDLTQILVVVVRYFGGTKLGVGGLINAYRTAAQQAIQAAQIVEKTIDEQYTIAFDYPLLSKVMRVIKDNSLEIISQKQELHCEYTLAVRKKEATRVLQLFKDTYGIKLLE